MAGRRNEQTGLEVAGAAGRGEASTGGASAPLQDEALYRVLEASRLQAVAEASAALTGDEFFRSAVRSLATAFGLQAAFIAECADYPTTRVRILAEWDRGHHTEPREFVLAGTPCDETVRNGRVRCLADNLLDRFPQYRSRGRTSYLGVPLLDAAGTDVIGHLAFWGGTPIEDQAILAHPIFRIFASRIGAELRRKRADDTMLLIAQATAPLAGEAFFRSLLHNLVCTFGFRQAFISECVDNPPTRVRTLAYWDEAGFRANSEFDLAGLPCSVTIRERQPYLIPDRLAELYPDEHGRQRVSYLGVPLFDGRGERVIGHLAFFDSRPRETNVLDNPVFRILASRAGVELLRKRAEDALRESEANYRLLVENQTDLLVKLDRQGRYVFVSPSFCECFGRVEAGLLGRPFDLEINPLDREAFEQSYASVLAPPHRGYAEARMLTSGGWRWLAWSVSAILDAGSAVAEIIACGRDVTERKRAEDQARQHLQSLAHVARLASMGEMATAIAHEVNQPLTAILSYSQACMRLLRGENAPIGEITDAMSRVAEGAERASQIIRHLRSLVRKDDAQRLPVQVNYLVGEVVRLVRPEARQSEVEIRTELAEGLPPVLADNIQIQQVLVNLVRNAIEAINGAATVERREVRVLTRTGPGNTVETRVEDTGPGFDGDTAATLFEPFLTTKAQGMGIGLSISRSIVEAHQGRIGAMGRPGYGASFWFTLPAATGEQQPS